jgi:hypothetical protein
MKTKLNIFIADPIDFLEGHLNWSLVVRTDTPEEVAKYSLDPYLTSIEVDLTANVTDLKAGVVATLKGDLTRTRVRAELECQSIESQIQNLLAIDHKPSLEVVS